MKYYLKQIITTTEGVTADEAKYVYDNENSALVRFHSLMAANMNEEKIATCTLIIFCDDGEHPLSMTRIETFRR